MVTLSKFALTIGVLAAPICMAQELQMKWGLENTWSYAEEVRTKDENLAVGGKGKGKKFRTIAFKDSDENVVRPMLQCFERHNKAWEAYQKTSGAHGKSGPWRLPQLPQIQLGGREEFNRFKAERDPFCVQNARRQAPKLYFDFVGRSNRQYVLERIEVTTVAFEEYKGGGFADKEVWYDIVLCHKPGEKSYEVEPRLVFHGTGRAVLRFWSDNFIEGMGWMAPMGEFTLKVKFVFSTDGGEKQVSTEVFKMDV